MSLDVQVDNRLYGGLVLRLNTVVDPYDTPVDVQELYGPMIIEFPDNDGTSAFVVQDDNGNVLFRADSAGNVGVLGAQFGSEVSVALVGQGTFKVYNTSSTIVFGVNNAGDVHHLGTALSQNTITYEEYSAGTGPNSPFWSSVGPFNGVTLSSAYSMPPLQLIDSAGNVVVKITESGDLLYTGGLFFGDIL